MHRHPSQDEIASEIEPPYQRSTPSPRPVARARKAKLRAALFDEPIQTSRFGRYHVLGPLGTGGMGTVLEAFDPTLDRRVAVKVLHTDVGKQHTQRLIREAQALARLSHPNVVQVYEAGEADGRAFVAMELVRGRTLAQWAQQNPRPGWKACIEVYLQAGRGLAAAHAQGLVHRDFKPTNAIVDHEGRVRVLDFGLARRTETVDDEHEEGQHDLPQTSTLDSALTLTGAILGTPAYMPPEQMRGQEANARSDQFSFCVSLFEAIDGRRPFDGSSPHGLLLAMSSGDVRPPTKGAGAPATLYRVLARGLDASPAARWPSMNALLTELQRLVTPPVRRWLGLGLAVGLAAIGGGLAWYAEVGSRCEGAREQLSGIWDPARTSELETAFMGTQLPLATNTWQVVRTRLDAYARDWADKHIEICEATRVTQTQPEAMMAVRMGCLSRRRVELRAVVQVLAHVDADRMNHAIDLVEHLPSLSRCDDVVALQAAVPPPPTDSGAAAKVEHARTWLADSWALRLSGDYPGAEALADDVARRTQALGYGPLNAETLLRRGQARSSNDEPEAALEDLERAYLLAEEHEHDRVAYDAVVDLVYVAGHQLRRLERADHWSSLALALADRRSTSSEARASALHAVGVARLDGGDPAGSRLLLQEALTLLQSHEPPRHSDIAITLMLIGVSLDRQDRWEEAVEYFQRALEIRRSVSGPEHPSVAHVLIQLATTLQSRGRLTDALDHFRRALRIFEQTLAPDHSHLAAAEGSIGNVLDMLGRPAEALLHHERALQIREARLGPHHPELAKTLANLANAHFGQGQHEDALDHYRRALDIQRRALGKEHSGLAGLHSNIGLVLTALERPGEALTHHQQALAIVEETLGSEESTVSLMLDNLGETHLALGMLPEAHAAYQRALTIAEKVAGPEHPLVAYALVGLAEVALGEDDPAQARPHAQRALAIRESSEGMPTELAQARFLLAQALWPDVAERPRALSLARQAQQTYAENPEGSALQETRLDAWLTEHG